MKKIIFLFSLLISFYTGATERTKNHVPLHKSGTTDIDMERERTPIKVPIEVLYDSETNVIEIWCDNDNIQAEVYIYNNHGSLEFHSFYMNIVIPLISYGDHYIVLRGDGWEATGSF